MIHPSVAEFVSRFRILQQVELPTPEVETSPISHTSWPSRSGDKPCCLLISPHPDDECLMGGLPLRLWQEKGWQIINIALTLGSDVDMRSTRLEELSKSCSLLGFDPLLPVANGFNDVSWKKREGNKVSWDALVRKLASIIEQYWPEVICFPHAHDEHPTHIGAHYLVLDSLLQLPSEFVTTLVRTEYWQPNQFPNLMIGLSEGDVAALLKALCCHTSQITRNPYHLSFPGYLLDNTRRGSERLKTVMGGDKVGFDFSSLYRIDRWQNKSVKAIDTALIVGPKDKLDFDYYKS